MGADLVIGVDVGAPLAREEDLTSFVAILSQAMGLLGATSTARQRDLCDLLITPDITDLSPMDFDRMAEIIAGGRAAAEAMLPELRALAADLGPSTDTPLRPPPAGPARFHLSDLAFEGLQETRIEVITDVCGLDVGDTVSLDDIERSVQRIYSTGFYERVSYRVESAPDGRRLRFFAVEKTVDFFRFGLRYDSYEELSAIFNLLLRNKPGRGSTLNLDVIVGSSNHIVLNHILHPGLHRGLALLSRLGYMDEFIDVYDESAPVFRIDVKAAYGEFLLGNTFSNRLALGAGVRGELVGIDVGYTLWEVPRLDENLFALVGALWWDSLNRTQFPTSGVSFYTRHEYSDRTWGSNTDFSRHFADLQAFAPLHGRVTLLGHLVAGTLTGDEPPVHYAFFLGGMDLPVLLLERRLSRVSFLGLNGRELAGRHIQFAQAGVQIEASHRMFFTLRANAGAAYDGETFDVQGQRYENGAGLTLGLRTPLGPLEITGAYGSREEFIGHLSFGMKF
jgi:outer membrane protein assembly factor BamA